MIDDNALRTGRSSSSSSVLFPWPQPLLMGWWPTTIFQAALDSVSAYPRSWQRATSSYVAVDQADFPHGHNGWFLIIIYLEEVCDVGVARSNPSPIKLGLVPVMEDEWRRVDEEEIRNSFVERKKNLY